MNKATRFGVSLPDNLLERFDRDIENKGYANRSEAIRDLIRRELVETEWKDSSRDTAAAVVIVYDHQESKITQDLTEKQHRHHNEVVSTMHVHLDHDNCMEVVLLRGKASDVKEIGDQLISAKHVKIGKFVPATTGQGI
ncbi:MAG: nickel-responsive transcriptional regulator NikR [Chitinivibrionales bacterium]